MVVGQDGAAHDGQVGVGAHEVVGELADKIQQLAEAGPVDLHGDMLSVEYNTMLIIINIGRVLHSPRTVIDCDWNDSVILSCRMICAACISLIFRTKQTFGIAA